MQPLRLRPALSYIVDNHVVDLISEVCAAVSPLGYLADPRATMAGIGMAAAVRSHDTAALFGWLFDVLSYQGVSDENAWRYMEEHGVALSHIVRRRRMRRDEERFEPLIRGRRDLRSEPLIDTLKGQWHDELWRAADSQLDRLYAADYAAERRGIYLVLWFGNALATGKKPRAQDARSRRPLAPEQLREGLIQMSEAARSGRIKIVVLDISRP